MPRFGSSSYGSGIYGDPKALPLTPAATSALTVTPATPGALTLTPVTPTALTLTPA